MPPKKKRKTFVPPYGAAITEDIYFIEKKNVQIEKEKKEAHMDTVPEIEKRAFKVPYRGTSDVPTEKPTEGKGKGPHPKSKKGKNLVNHTDNSVHDPSDEDDMIPCTDVRRGSRMHLIKTGA